MELIVCVVEWEKQGCFKEVKKKNKAMGKVLGKFRKYKKNIKGAVEACMKAAKGKNWRSLGFVANSSVRQPKAMLITRCMVHHPKGAKKKEITESE